MPDIIEAADALLVTATTTFLVWYGRYVMIRRAYLLAKIATIRARIEINEHWPNTGGFEWKGEGSWS
jgi:hypothetical protein